MTCAFYVLSLSLWSIRTFSAHVNDSVRSEVDASIACAYVHLKLPRDSRGKRTGHERNFEENQRNYERATQFGIGSEKI